MRALRLVVLVALGVVLADEGEEKDMEPVVWKGGKTLYENGETHYNGLGTRAQMHDCFAYIAIPKLKPDVRSSCVKLDMRKQIGSHTEHILTPFPLNEPKDPHSNDKLQSVVDLIIDHHNFLWVLDVGAIYRGEHESDPPIICKPKVVCYDTNDGKVIHKIDLMPYVHPESRLQFIVCDNNHKGEQFVYVSDAGTKTIIVINIHQGSAHRVHLPASVLNEYAPPDVLYLFLAKRHTGQNKLYFSYRSGEGLWCINTEDLQRDNSLDKAIEVGKKKTPLIFLGTDEWSTVYFRKAENSLDKFQDSKPHPNNDVYKWDTETEFDENNFQLVHKDPAKQELSLVPTHAITDYKNGVMRLCASNLVPYLHKDCLCEQSVNALTVMAISEEHQPTGQHEL